MTPKSVSAVQRLTQSMRAYQRHYSGRTLLEKSYDALGLSMQLKDKRSWPTREESYAAIQVRRQDRDWNTYRKFSSILQSNKPNRRGPVPSIKKMLPVKSASSRQYSQEQMEAVSKTQEKRCHVPEDADQKTCSVKEFIVEDLDNEDDTEIQRAIDDDLLRRVSKNRNFSREAPFSKKVIAPYSTYSNHRSRWAEFRHRMVYGSINN